MKISVAAPMILAGFQAGLTVEQACECVSITARTFYNWMNRGETDLREGKHSEHRSFYEAVMALRSKQFDGLMTIAMQPDYREEVHNGEVFTLRTWTADRALKIADRRFPAGNPVSDLIEAEVVGEEKAQEAFEKLMEARRVRQIPAEAGPTS